MPSSSGFDHQPAPICHCCECCAVAAGENPTDANNFFQPSRGTPNVTGPTLSQATGGPLNISLGDSRQYSSSGSGAGGMRSGPGGGQYGNHWVNPDLPHLVFVGEDEIRLESGATETKTFIKVGTRWQAEYFVRDTLTYDAEVRVYIVTSPEGDRTFFSEFGLLVAKGNAYGTQAVYTYIGDELHSVQVGSGVNAVVYIYSFDTLGRLESVVLRVGGTTSAADCRRISYEYSVAGNLERITLDEKRDGTWQEVETAYYRYYSAGSKLLRFVVADHAYKQMKSVNSSWPEAATDAELAEYADAEFAYDADGPVQQVKTNGGKYAFDISYATSMHSGATANVWTNKTIIAMPDGSTRTYYFNRSSSLLLLKISEPQESGPDKVWYPICQRFDSNSRVVKNASSSAIELVDESHPTLVTFKSHEGMLRVFEYDSVGNLLLEALRKGIDGSLVKQVERSFTSHTMGEVTIYEVLTETIYRDATSTAASNPVTTTFAYVWRESGGNPTFQLDTKTTTLPAVPNSENGDNQTGTIVEKYDSHGYLTEMTDAVGTKRTYEYFNLSGAMKQMVEDAGTGRLNLTTDYEADQLGRMTLSKGPEHTISLDGTATGIRRAQWVQYLDSQDEVRTMNGYIQSSDSSEHIVNPVQISVSYANDPGVTGGYMTESIAAVYGGSGVPPETTTFAQSNYVRWSTRSYDHHAQQTHARLYHLIPTSGQGSSGTNYAETSYGYDSAGRQNKITSPEGTITTAVYNAMSWNMESKVGTTDLNSVSVILNEYDDDGNLTQITRPVDGTSFNDRVNVFRYDWRERQVESEVNDGTRTIITRQTYDNRNNVTRVDEYQSSVTNANLINRAQSLFDARNRQYRTKRFGVAVGTGTLQPALTAEFYFDQAGRMIRQTPAGKVGFNAMEYDVLGRVIKQYNAFGGTLDLEHPNSVSGATVMEQTELEYDDAGSLISTTLRQRFDDATGTGPLGNPSIEPKARVSYAATYADALGRTQAIANYGTNGAAPWTRPDSVPARSDAVLVTTFTFDDAGQQKEIADAMDTITRREYDQAGRQVALIENYISGGPSAPDVNKTTQYEYNLDGNLKKLTAVNPTTGDQVSEWFYGVTLAQGSALESNALVYQKAYPDSIGSADRVALEYNRQGQVVKMTDQAGTSHEYAYDKLGRLLQDTVTAFGSGVDDAVISIERSYEVRGMLRTVTSNGSSGALNEVRFDYNDYSQLAKDYQGHNGPVDPGATLFVGYEYEDGSANTVRRTKINYPDGTTTIGIAYDGPAADALSRPDAVKEGSSALCTYRYLGLVMVIGVKYDGASDVELTYQDGGVGDAGDPYTGLDRFGRLVETLWKKASADQVRSKYGRNRFSGVVWRRDDTAHAQSVDTEDNYYWYDGLYQVTENQRGNLTGIYPDYTGISDIQKAFEWEYDATGNWTGTTVASESDGYVLVGILGGLTSTGFSFGHLIGTPPVEVGDTIEVEGAPFTVTDVTINSPVDPATEDGFYTITVAESTSGLSDGDDVKAEGLMVLPQQRQHNQSNEITYLWPPGTPEPEYDPAGNMTLLPPILGAQPVQQVFAWDAWNRLTEVKEGGMTVAEYTYDGLTRRLTKTTSIETRHYYYNDQWRALEERVSGSPTAVDCQYTWGIRDRWDLVRRKRSTGGGFLNETFFSLRDYLDPVAIVGEDGLVKERYAYDAFGAARTLSPDFTVVAPAFDWNFLFHAEFLDDVVQLYNYGYRYYTPLLGRWLTLDLLGELQSQNLVCYVKNQPTKYIDMLGLAEFDYNGNLSWDERINGGRWRGPNGSFTKAPDLNPPPWAKQIPPDANKYRGESGSGETIETMANYLGNAIQLLQKLMESVNKLQKVDPAVGKFGAAACGEQAKKRGQKFNSATPQKYCPCCCRIFFLDYHDNEANPGPLYQSASLLSGSCDSIQKQEAQQAAAGIGTIGEGDNVTYPHAADADFDFTQKMFKKNGLWFTKASVDIDANCG
jgi:RHS repeat-associated protein